MTAAGPRKIDGRTWIDMRLYAMSADELAAVSQDLSAFVGALAPDKRATARALLDLGDLVVRELMCRAFGNTAEARDHAEAVYRDKARKAAN
jgi:hypothetical protein